MTGQGTREQATQGTERRPNAAAAGIWRQCACVSLILLAAAVATAPLRLYGFSVGHDFDFHFVSWLDALHSWRQGVVYPHWAPTPNYGAGEPRFVFYPPLTWMLGAALGAIFDWRHVPLVLTFLLLAGVGLATRALARQVLDDGPATLAGCFALFSGYTLFTVYERSAYAELAGGIWIPLLLLVLKEQEQDRVVNRTAWQLALVVAAAWLSNAPVGVMASYLLAALTVLLAMLRRSWKPVGRSALAVALGLGLCGFYLVPAAQEQKWVDIRQAVDDPGERVENSFLFGHHADPRLEEHDVELLKVSILGTILLGATLAGIAVSWRRGTMPGGRAWRWALVLVPAGVLVLMLPISLPLWNVLPKMRFLQFPWRWLVVLEAPMGIWVASAVWMRGRVRQRVVLALCGVFFAVSAGAAGVLMMQNCDPDETVLGVWQSYRTGAGVVGTDEYAPPNSDDTQVATNLPAGCLSTAPNVKLGQGDADLTPDWNAAQGSCLATYAFAGQGGQRGVQGASQRGMQGNPEHLRMQVNAPQAGFLIVRLRRYPAWAVAVNGKAVETQGTRQDGLMVFPVAQGASELRFDWQTTPDVLLGRWLSVLAVTAFAGVVAWGRRKSAVG